MDPRIRSVLETIYAEGGPMAFTLGDASKRLGVSEAHLRRLFKKEVGTAFRRYLRTVRMQKAGKMLANYSVGIKAIASNVGYSDLSNFYQDFKKVHGVTPRQFRLGRLSQEMDIPKGKQQRSA
jgi:AraC-like DNA-binding protein